MNRRRAVMLLSVSIGLGALALACGAALTATAGWLIVQASTHPPVLTMLVAIVAVRTFGIARPALRYAERVIGHDAALRGLGDLRVRVYTSLIPLTPGRLGGRRRGELLAHVVEDVDAHVDRMLRVVAPAAIGLCVAAGAVIGTSLLLPAAGLVLAVVLVVGGLVGPALVLAAAGRSEPKAVEAHADVARKVTALLEGAPDLVGNNATTRYLDRLGASERQLQRARRRTGSAIAAADALAVAALGCGVVGVLAVGGPAVAAGILSAPMLALIALLPLGLSDVLTPLPTAAALAMRANRARRRLRGLEALQPAVPSQPVPSRTLDTGPLSATKPPAIQFRGVTARWLDEGPDVLGPVHLELPPGSRLGVVGPSGCGKSTMVALLTRAIDPATGSVRYDGIDGRDLPPDAIRSVVGLVDDDPHVFGTSLVENVRLARPAASDAEVESALRAARLSSWLDSLPMGLQTRIGEGGEAVSGGERARIALARVLLADQPVLVLDEPTAHLDEQTAEDVLTDLLTAGGPRTVVVVGHRRDGFDELDAVLDLGAAGARPSDTVGLEQTSRLGVL